MCGLAGKISTRTAGELSHLVERSLDFLEHRGPDDRGSQIFRSGNWAVALGHTRLSIIDLSDAGHQPMVSEDGRYAIVFNGEIYNYKEIRQELSNRGALVATETDTEVLLSAWVTWGPDVLSRLVGMFAFAVLDTVDQTLTIVRDGFGIKPLFWSLTNNEFSFASEVKAIERVMGQRLSPNNSVVARYLMMGIYDMGPETFFDGVFRVEPGTLLSLNLAQDRLRPVIRTWWQPEVNLSGPTDLGEAAELVREKFLESVSLHLRSDVSLGFALSGGIDSSAIVHAARFLEPDLPIKTFSFISPGAPDNEEPWIDIVNESVGAESFKVSSNPVTLEADLFDLIETPGEPFGDTSIYAQYIVYRLAKESGVTVTLDGQGADEIFAGYSGYVERRLQSLAQEWKFFDAISLLGEWSKWPGRSRSDVIQRLASFYLPDKWVRSMRSALGSRSGGINLSWLNRDAKYHFESVYDTNVGERGRQLASILRWELTRGGLGSRLRHGDRNSMRWSIESRVPFLTIPLAESALGLSEEFLLSRGGETKHVLRKALRGIVPDRTLDRRDKIGFQTPESAWLVGLGADTITSWLVGLDHLPVVNPVAARFGIRTQLKQGRPTQEVWRYLNVAVWAEMFFGRSA